jgi:hypothetical protein
MLRKTIKRFSNKFYLFLIFNIAFLIFSCGEGIVDFGEGNYQPKIVVEGYIYPGKALKSIKICRNFPLNTVIDSSTIFIPNATVKISDVSAGKDYQLRYNPAKKSYEYLGSDLSIGYGKSYKLTVYANIAGKELIASSVTTTPLKGMEIEFSKSVLNDMKYREKNSLGELIKNKIVFKSSPGTDFYVFSIMALDASKSSFIYDNPMFSDTVEVIKHIDNLSFRYLWMQNVSSVVTEFEQEIDWLSTWFYGRYEIIVYAGDQNFKDYLLTHSQVMEMDGNVHEPRFHFEGDGIGVFGSAISDSAYFNVVK